MKKQPASLYLRFNVLFTITSLISYSVSGQKATVKSPALSENINKIVSVSCVPCHTSTGGMMSRAKLNFTEWTNYSPEKQKEKAEKIYSVLKKGSMPPKAARENRPDIIPTKDQIESIKKWAESLKSGK